MKNIKNNLRNFKSCCEEAPAATYMDAKILNRVIGEAVDELMAKIRGTGLKANNCDGAYLLEAQIYQYIKGSNPESGLFPEAEGFGGSMYGPERKRVIAQAERDRDFLATLTT